MTDGQKVAKEFLRLNLNPVPVSENKEPLRKKFHSSLMTEEEIMEYDFEHIGIATGIISGCLEAIDFDLKNAPNPKRVMKDFKSKLPKKLLERLVVQQTISGGYHMIYRCETVHSSQKLAKNKDGLAIIETRGEGGYIKCSPSEGYKLIQNSFDKIPIITEAERLSLIGSAKMLNATLLKDSEKRLTDEQKRYKSKFPDYDEDIEIGLELLLSNGWQIASQDSVWVNFTRPNKSVKDGISGGYNKDGKFFYCFSTSQDSFEPLRPYDNHSMFAVLECGGRFDIAYAKLYEQGYGIKDDDDDEEEWDVKLKNLSFLSDAIEENSYLEQARKNEIEQGLSTGWEDLDDYIRLKHNSFNMGLGYDGVGKSLLMLSIAQASNVLHNWKWGMIMPENKTAMSRRRLIECESGKFITQFKDCPELFDKYLQKSRENFKIISNKKHYSILDVIDMGKRLYEYYGIDALLIDPYNFFKVTGNGYSHNNEILSQLRVFAEKYCSVYVMAHPSSTAPRTQKDGNGFLKAPTKYDIQGGADFPYRVDDFFVLHRVTNHPDPDTRKTMQFIVEKVKEVETGGNRHPSGEWSELIWENRNGFIGYWDTKGNNPMYKAQASKIGLEEKIRTLTPEEAF